MLGFASRYVKTESSSTAFARRTVSFDIRPFRIGRAHHRSDQHVVRRIVELDR